MVFVKTLIFYLKYRKSLEDFKVGVTRSNLIFFKDLSDSNIETKLQRTEVNLESCIFLTIKIKCIFVK